MKTIFFYQPLCSENGQNPIKLAKGMLLLSGMHTKVSESFVNNSYDLVLVSVPPAPKITTLTKMGIFLWNFRGWCSHNLTICTENLREFHQHLLWAVSSQGATNPQVNLWKSWFFYFDQLPLSQKREFSCEILVISWQYAQIIWESFINICYGLLVVSMPPTPKLTYENPGFSTLTNYHSHKNINFLLKFSWVMLS